MTRGRLIIGITKAVFCIAVVGVSVRYLSWKDTVILRDGRRATILCESDQGLVIRDPGAGRGTPEQRLIASESIEQTHPGVRTMLARLRLSMLALALSVYPVMVLAVASRWAQLIGCVGPPVPHRTTYIWHLRATVSDALGMGQIGLETCRAVMAGKWLGSYVAALSVQVVERGLGIVAVLMLAVVGVALMAEAVPDGTYTILLLGAAILGATALAATHRLSCGRISRGLGTRSAPPTGRFGRLIATFSSTALKTARSPSTIGYAIVLSVAIHLLIVIQHWLLAASLGLEIGLKVLLIAIPIVTVLVALPISFQGIGVFEGAMVLLLTELTGQSTGEILVLCALHRIVAIMQRLLSVIALWIPTGQTAVPLESPAPG